MNFYDKYFYVAAQKFRAERALGDFWMLYWVYEHGQFAALEQFIHSFDTFEECKEYAELLMGV